MKPALLYLLVAGLLTGGPLLAADIWVSPNGNDVNAGTREQPLQTVTMALRKARELRRLNDPAVAAGVHIILKGGTYRLYEQVFVRPEDSGTPESPTVIEAAPNEKPVFSGGVSITGWNKLSVKTPGLPAEAQGRIWTADVPMVEGRLLEFRQLWVNEQKAIRARYPDGDTMNRILSWDHATEQCVIPVPAIGDLDKVSGLELFIHQWWAIANLRIRSFTTQGDSVRLGFYQPESKIQSEHPWPAPWLSQKTGNSAFYLTNALQFVNRPGEWFLDVVNRKIYYYPRTGENMNTASVVAPSLQTLVRVEGTIDRPVKHVYFKGIHFQYTTWLRPSQQGHVPLQAGMYLLDAYKLKVPGTPDKQGLENQAWIGRQPSAVVLQYVQYTGLERCYFRHTAATALDYIKGTYKDSVVGCSFRDIGGTAIQAGIFSEEAEETHLPYKPLSEREECRNLTIKNNYITDATNEDWGCVGIGAGNVQNITIDHNEVCNVNYSGICVGWGWTKTFNSMRNNRIHANLVHHYARNMYDVGGIYTLSAQPNSVISENCIHTILKAPYAHDPNHFFYIYLDEGSSYITLSNNWCEAEKFMKNANGPANIWENNGPMVSEQIKNAAGLEAEYREMKNMK